MRFLRSLRSGWKYLAATALVAAIGLAALAALAGLGVLGWESAALVAAVGAAAAANTLLMVRLTRRVSALDRRLRDADRRLDTRGREVAEAVGAGRAELSKSLSGTRAELEQVRAKALPSMSKELTEAVTVQGRHDYEQQVAWTELREYLGAGPFMPALRGWAASPDVMRLLVRLVDTNRPDLVVECGSGASSVWLGYALRRAGRGRLVALEHTERYAELSRQLVRDHRLEDIVEVRHAPLTDWSPLPDTDTDGAAAEARPWYDTSAVEDLHDIGVVFVDGPPAGTAKQARYPALPVLLPRSAPDAVFVLDDAGRPDERAIGKRWLQDFPELGSREEQAEKGARVFVRKAL
ncbi:class I SAM-dependent methyltransferase [Streptomonospora wellingtoniae]|uniref:Class I SAM-dependent methyltransferase n=1 Tax=Streptomonospora wellingtoniae TaxID=3075544 RepID=A0ABU2KNY7_9ACTN|nr:class I SAM-dependent methyltransferase [Streptomonospora sp. DSM 45055]MDT0300974.1 class I SAM-dependent methyltransferase [Streptomonospora sp. DSM 45055]